MRGLGLIVYGVEGIGKSGFAFQFPTPLRCISVNETGYEDLDDLGEVPDGCTNDYAENWDDLLVQLDPGNMATRENKTVVVDSLSGVAQFMEQDILQKAFDGPMEKRIEAFGSFMTGWRIHGPIWAGRLENKLNLLRQKGINIILIGHHKTITKRNAVAADYRSTKINMDDGPKEVLTKWAQAVMFMTMDFNLFVTKTWKSKPTEAKVTDSVNEEVGRIIYTTKHPAHDAKNRLKLPPFIHMGDSAQEAYTNFVKCLQPNFQEHLGFNPNE